MKLLFVNACPRLEESRTLALARAFMQELTALRPDAAVTEHCLPRMNLRPIDQAGLALREPLCDARAWEHPFLRPAVEFQQADAVVIAAPYWDLAFPAMLKVWVENVYVRNLTFRYEHDRCIGLCRGREAVYITTAGSPVGGNDWGAGYMRAVLASLGIGGFTEVKAEGIDLEGCDVEAVLRRAEEEARQAARLLAGRMP
ncbi:MAG: NAD(P)H-dependent oxidoreductase [Aristaeellaceae bacterium]